MTSMTYQVTGMTCEHCVRAVTEEIESLDGVSAVAVELVPGGISAVTVTSDPRSPRRRSRPPWTRQAPTACPAMRLTDDRWQCHCGQWQHRDGPPRAVPAA